MDLESRRRWEMYTKAKEEMLERTNIPEARWWVVEGVDKKQTPLNCFGHFGNRPNESDHQVHYIVVSTTAI
jgi:polyphosphate kinase 2 (PPK2 family)